MTAWAIHDTETGALERVVMNDPADLGLSLTGKAVVTLAQMPDLSAERWNPATRAFEAHTPARHLTSLQVLGLYTAAQHARARRMISEVYPVGHEWAGQLVDPDGLVQRLLDATLALPGTISTDDPWLVNGTTLLRGLGVIESNAEAARILAGTPAP